MSGNVGSETTCQKLQNSETIILIGRFRTYVLRPKTMTAGIIANAEQPGRYKIDRSGVVSKYVGKTEKRLNKIFLKVEHNNLMLSFGGANVLSGRRSTVNHGGGTFQEIVKV